MTEPINIKGTRKGLVILCNSNAEFEDIKNYLHKKMTSAKGFFKGAKFTLHHQQKLLENQITELEKICTEHGLIRNEETIELPDLTPKNKVINSNITLEHKDKRMPPNGEQTLLVRRTIRSGQNITYPGHVVIMGDMHAGSEVIAEGSVMVLGKCSGVVHAGATGNPDAKVIANKLCPTQLRIGSAIVRSPDEEPQYPEVAKLKDNEIIVEKYSATSL